MNKKNEEFYNHIKQMQKTFHQEIPRPIENVLMPSLEELDKAFTNLLYYLSMHSSNDEEEFYF